MKCLSVKLKLGLCYPYSPYFRVPNFPAELLKYWYKGSSISTTNALITMILCMHVDHQVFHQFLQAGGATWIFKNFYALFLFFIPSKMQSSVNQAQIMSSYGNQANISGGPYEGLG